MINELKDLGLTEGEAKTYFALVKLGSSKVGAIVKEAKVSYSKVYDILNRLLEKGLASYIVKEKTKYFQANPPSRFKDYLNREKDKLQEKVSLFNELLPRLKELENAGKKKEEAEIFVGFKSIKAAYEKLLQNHNKREELLFFYVYNSSEIEKADLFYKQLFHYLKTLNIKLKGVSTVDLKKSKIFKSPPRFIKLRFVNFPLPSTMDIYKDKVLLVSFGNKPTAYLINSEGIANNYRNYFHEIWGRARP